MTRTEIPAVLLVDKPEGPTSHDVVRAARRALGTRRVGHTGTLDPFASGLLILCAGKATRLAEYFHLLPKTYSATAVLGVETDTEDGTGSVTSRCEAWRSVTREEIEKAARDLRGQQSQVPPAYSAKKVDGRRAYAAARAGEAVELSSKVVCVHSLEVGEVRLPEVDFRVEVSTGTYVRSIARDLGKRLGCGAHLKSLRRASIGPFRVEDAVSLAELLEGRLPADATRTAADSLSWLPTRQLTRAELADVAHGRAIPLSGGLRDTDLPVAMVAGGHLVAVARAGASGLRPEKVFHEA